MNVRIVLRGCTPAGRIVVVAIVWGEEAGGCGGWTVGATRTEAQQLRRHLRTNRVCAGGAKGQNPEYKIVGNFSLGYFAKKEKLFLCVCVFRE